MIRIGYVGVNTLLPSASRTFRLANYSEERMLAVARENLAALRTILEWNRDNGVALFRITSNLIPFASSTINSGSWRTALAEEFRELGRFIRRHGMRVSMHPGQYAVLNTPHPEIFQSTLRELDYHLHVLLLMGLNADHKIILHGGGAYGDKRSALGVLEQRIRKLPAALRQRLVLENDERVFTAADILAACRATGTPAVFDVFHHSVLQSFPGLSAREIILLFTPTWGGLRQKVHYSDQEPSKGPGAHSATIDVAAFGTLLHAVRGLELDIMLEVKDKQASLLKLRAVYPELR